MSCPLCGEYCRCAEPRAFQAPASGLVDAEAPDSSEEQFAASLSAPPCAEPARGGEPPPRYSRIVMPEPEPVEEQFAAAVNEQFALAPQFHGAEPEIWRQEVVSRVESYRAKRRRRGLPTRERSLRLNFEALQQLEAPRQELTPEPAPPPAAVEVRWDGTVFDPAAAAEPEPEVSNVIEFPGPVAEELAGPVIETPRILDAPEMVEQAIPTAMAEISLENEAEDTELTEIEIPLQVAPLPQRVFGGLIDLLIVLVATGVFGLIVLKIAEGIPLSKAVLAVALAVPCFFWAAYQYLFLVHAGRTPGMQLARVELIGFEGDPVGRDRRRWRALALALSTVSLGLGFIWALVDEDTLTWHDRITRTYAVEVTESR